MRSPLLALLIACSFTALVYAKITTTSYSANGPVIFNTGGVALLTIDDQACRDQKFTLASTSVDGATVSFSFTGTGITLNCMTDTDRGSYTITVDGANSRTVSGISSARSCTAIYSVTGLANAPHTFLLKTAKQNLSGSTTDTSAKFEFMSFEVTSPDDPTPTTPTTPNSTPDTSSVTTPNTPGATNELSSSAGLPAGAIAGIVVGAVLGLVAIAAGLFFYRRHRRGLASPQPGPPTPQAFAPPSQTPATSQYMGYPELMSSSPPPRPVSSYTTPYSQPSAYPYSYTPPR